MRKLAALTCALPLSWVAPGVPQRASAQADASFRATCPELRGALAKLPRDAAERQTTIEVVGKLEFVRKGEALTYMVMCAEPHPKVLCVTYEDGGHKPGDEVVIAGTFSMPDRNHVLLDPCLWTERE